MKQIEPQAELGKQGLLPDAYQSFDLKPIPSDSARPRCQQVSSWLRLREQLDAAAWLEVRYEDLVQDLPTAARRALAFLKLSWEEAVLGYRDRLATKTVHSPTYLDVAQPIHRRPIGRWKNYARWLAPQLGDLDRFVKNFGYT